MLPFIVKNEAIFFCVCSALQILNRRQNSYSKFGAQGLVNVNLATNAELFSVIIIHLAQVLLGAENREIAIACLRFTLSDNHRLFG